MLDIKRIRKNIGAVSGELQRRGYTLDVGNLTHLEDRRKTLQTQIEQWQQQKNQQAKAIGQAKSQGQDIAELVQQADSIDDSLEKAKQEFEEISEQLHDILQALPNIPQSSVPNGRSEEDNVEVRRWGQIPEFDFEIQDHVTLGNNINGLDFESAAKLSGSRFAVMYGSVAKLHRCLTQFMLDVQTQQHGYQEVYVPYLVNRDSLYGTAQLPKFADDLFNLPEQDGLSLISTAEIPITNLVRDSILAEDDLPIRWVAHTPCFRREAGSYGRDTRGMIRQHQFEKVELVQIVHPDSSKSAHEELTGHAETILQKLELPYRVVNLCAGDLGFAAAKTYDLEVWLPAQEKYREISSCSNFEDFQARRMQARWREADGKKKHFVHTLNGSGLAVGRALVAVLENYQMSNGQIAVPKALQPYMQCDVIGESQL